jgi:hypothetical protein
LLTDLKLKERCDRTCLEGNLRLALIVGEMQESLKHLTLFGLNMIVVTHPTIDGRDLMSVRMSTLILAKTQ